MWPSDNHMHMWFFPKLVHIIAWNQCYDFHSLEHVPAVGPPLKTFQWTFQWLHLNYQVTSIVQYARPSCSTSVPNQFPKALVAELADISTAILQNLVESIPNSVDTVITAKRGYDFEQVVQNTRIGRMVRSYLWPYSVPWANWKKIWFLLELDVLRPVSRPLFLLQSWQSLVLVLSWSCCLALISYRLRQQYLRRTA